MQNDRSISAVYYLLQGKQSIQTIQDAQLYDLTSFYGIYKDLSKERFYTYIHDFVDQGLLYSNDNSNDYTLTEKGTEVVVHNQLETTFLDGNSYRSYDQIYFARLLLLIQVWTNSKKKNSTYIPIIENKEIEDWVKKYYRKTRYNISENLNLLYKELASILTFLPPDHPSLFISQFTSYKSIGLTKEQLAIKSGYTLEDVHIITINTVHLILNKMKEYKLLFTIGKDLLPQNNLTESAKYTNHLLKKSLSLQEIARTRQLKLNTIYDHLVEIALYDENFNLSAYVPDTYRKEILQAINVVKSYKLKEIKDNIDQNISYFQIRLVLSKLNEL